MKKKKRSPVLPLLLVFAVLAGFAAWLILDRMQLAAPVSGTEAAEPAQKPQLPSLFAPDPPEIGTLTLPALAPAAGDEAIAEAYARSWRYALDGTVQTEDRQARQAVTVTHLDQEKLAEGLADDVNALLARNVAAAASPAEVYDENRQYLPAQVDAAWTEALNARLAQPEDYLIDESVSLEYSYADGAWTLLNPEALAPGLPDGAALRAGATQTLVYVPFPYKIDEYALCGPVPREENYGYTTDPAEVSAMLARPEAQRLIGEETLVWNENLTRIPNTGISWYLDETLLVIVWQECEAGGIGTFSEIFISDGSQLRRKIAGDEVWSTHFTTTSNYAANANAVLCLGGDFYYHGRACGISVYQRAIHRFEPYSCDTCFFTSDGDMLFAYRGQMTDQAAAEQFIADNDVLFSLAFGPVLIDNGVDMTPELYPWGEINDTYARSALGLFGRHHYLAMNINCGTPNSGYYYLATLRQAADAMLRRGCVKAYTLDGGQTATTVFHNTLINPVQFGWQKDISDVIYFATAIPNDPETADPGE